MSRADIGLVSSRKDFYYIDAVAAAGSIAEVLRSGPDF